MPSFVPWELSPPMFLVLYPNSLIFQVPCPVAVGTVYYYRNKHLLE